jgi:hypothetical protein
MGNRTGDTRDTSCGLCGAQTRYRADDTYYVHSTPEGWRDGADVEQGGIRCAAAGLTYSQARGMRCTFIDPSNPTLRVQVWDGGDTTSLRVLHDTEALTLELWPHFTPAQARRIARELEIMADVQDERIEREAQRVRQQSERAERDAAADPLTHMFPAPGAM